MGISNRNLPYDANTVNYLYSNVSTLFIGNDTLIMWIMDLQNYFYNWQNVQIIKETIFIVKNILDVQALRFIEDSAIL